MKLIFSFFAAVIAVIIGGAIYYGAAYTVTVREEDIGPFFLIFESNKGHYKKTGDSVKKLMDFASQKQITPLAGFGLFLDDPQKVPEADLRSEAGIIVTADDYTKLQSELGEFQHKEQPLFRAVVSEFPMKGSASIIIGIFKVYPVLMKYITEKGYKPAFSYEIYEMSNKRIRYAFSIPE